MVLAITFVLIVVAQSFSVFAYDTSQSKYADIIFVIDDSASMKTTDPAGLSTLAIQKFVENTVQNENIRFGIVTYYDEIVDSIGLGDCEREAIKEFARDQITRNGDWTDAAVGLAWAVNEFTESSDDSCDKFIILIGDGVNDWSKSTFATSDKISTESLEQSIEEINTQGITVYTLALNARTSVPNVGGMGSNQGNSMGAQTPPNPNTNNSANAIEDNGIGEYFENIVEKTTGIAFEPQSVEDIENNMTSIIKDIFPDAEIEEDEEIDIPGGKSVTKTTTVPTGVFEMNLQIDNSIPLNVEFTDPAGNTYDKNSSNITYVQEAQYSNYKILNPDSGDWEITYISDYDQTISTRLTFYFNLEIILQQDKDSIEVTEQNSYEVSIVLGENTIIDDRAEGFDATLYTMKESGDIIIEHSMTYQQGSCTYTADVDFDAEGNYIIYAQLVSATQDELTSNELILSVEKPVNPPNSPNPSIDFRFLLLLIPLFALAAIILLLRKKSSDIIPYLRVNMCINVKARMDIYTFEKKTLDCMTLIGKCNSFSVLTDAYRNKCFDTLTFPADIEKVNDYLNRKFSEAVSAITVKGIKGGQAIITIPAINDIKINNDVVVKTKQIKLYNETEQVRLEFLVDNIIYRIDLTFSRN